MVTLAIPTPAVRETGAVATIAATAIPAKQAAIMTHIAVLLSSLPVSNWFQTGCL